MFRRDLPFSSVRMPWSRRTKCPDATFPVTPCPRYFNLRCCAANLRLEPHGCTAFPRGSCEGFISSPHILPHELQSLPWKFENPVWKDLICPRRYALSAVVQQCISPLITKSNVYVDRVTCERSSVLHVMSIDRTSNSF